MEGKEIKKGVFEEIELAYDLQQYLMHSKDVKVDPKLKGEIVEFSPETILSVTKKIQSPTEIISVTVVDDEFVKSSFPSVRF